MGLWGGSMFLANGAPTLLGFYDITTTDAESKYKQLFGVDPTFNNGNATMISIIQHSLLSFLYLFSPIAMVYGVHKFIYGNLLPDSSLYVLELWAGNPDPWG